jgi:Domain of Unknown Function (DUF1206)
MTSLGLGHESRPAREVAPWVKWLARMGMVCSALLWLVVGALAVGVAVGAGGATTDRTGALQEIGKQSWGNVLLILLAVGFAGYAVWRFVAAALGARWRRTRSSAWAGGSGTQREAFSMPSSATRP